MGVACKLLLLSPAVAALAITGCGAGPTAASPAPSNPALVNGNWSIAGSRTPAVFPLLSTSLAVNGSSITGEGYMQVQCPNAFGSSIGGTMELSGQINPDGTFKLATPSLNSLQVILSGTAPSSASPKAWTGTYSIGPVAGYTSCAYTQTATFSATSIPPLNGAYVGNLTSASNGPTPATSVSLTLQLTQPGISPVTLGSEAVYWDLLAGTLAVTGSPCFTHGTANRGSRIAGDAVSLIFTMDDGSEVNFVGNLNDLAGSSLTGRVLGSLPPGPVCSSVLGSGTFIRQ